MDFINGIIDVIQTTPVIHTDRSWHAKDIAEGTLRRMNENAEYKVLMESFAGLYQDALNRGIPTARACAVILSTHEDIMRAVISKALREKLVTLGASDLATLNAAYADLSFQEKLKASKDALDVVEAKFRLYVENEKTAQFKYSLLYAAERFGSEDEKLAVNSLVKKIKDEPKRK